MNEKSQAQLDAEAAVEAAQRVLDDANGTQDVAPELILAAEQALADAKAALVRLIESEAAAEAKAAAAIARKVGKLDVPEGSVVLKGPNCSVGGVSYEANKDGFVIVAEEHAEVLCRDHGFARV